MNNPNKLNMPNNLFPCLRFVVTLSILLVVGCQNSNEPTAEKKSSVESKTTITAMAKPKSQDTIVMGSIGEPSTLIPVLASDSASSDIIGMVFNGLVRYDKNLTIEGDLAKSWDISDDQLTITFHLREGVTWHDGKPFTAEDVLFTYRLYVNPEIPTAYSERYKQVQSAEVIDPFTFKVVYEKPLATALISWAFSIHPKHLLDKVDILTTDFARNPIGTGPYTFDRWNSGKEVILKANPNYFEGIPKIGKIRYRIIPDQSTMFLELKAGGLDHMGLTPLQYSRRASDQSFNEKFNMYRYLSSSYTYLGFNQSSELFQDKRVRKAIAHAIDRQEIIDGVLHGLGSPADGPYKPGTWAHNTKLAQYVYNPGKAKSMLQEAGWLDTDNDGIVEKDGRTLSFTIMTNQGNDQRIKTAEILQRRLQEVGVEVKIRVIEWASFLKEFIDTGDFEAIIMGWTIPPDPDGYNVWHSSKTNPGELNFIGFKNAEVDQLLETGRRTLVQEERTKIYDRFQDILVDEVPYVFLYVPDALPVVAKRFQGIEPAPAGIMYNFIDWHVGDDQVKYP